MADESLVYSPTHYERAEYINLQSTANR